MSILKWTAGARRNPTCVVMGRADTGGSSFELPALEAFHLAGRLFGAGLECMDPEKSYGVPGDPGHITLWVEEEGLSSEFGAGPAWIPRNLSNTREIHQAIRECQKDGTPYRLTVDVVTDPLAPPTPKE